MSGCVDVQKIIQHDVPEGRAQLESSNTNLEKVAAYCEANYFQARDKKAAFAETKQYAIQSLASVSYQINTLANSMLAVLDSQAEKLENMSNAVFDLDQRVKIHKEKVSRREIGQLTTNKVVARQFKIVQPVEPEQNRRYHRTPIDYSILDGIGHPVRITQMSRVPIGYNTIGHSHPINRTESAISSHSSSGQKMSGSLGQSYGNRTATLTRGQSQRSTGSSNAHVQYGQCPPNRYQTMQSPAIYSTHQVTPASSSGYATGQYAQGLNITVDGHNDEMPPPPSPLSGYGEQEYSPPLPPPPPQMHSEQPSRGYMPDLPVYGTLVKRPHQSNKPEWLVGVNVIEKVVAMYDYEASKPDELSFNENAIIFVVAKNDDGWFEGVCDGITGLFPGNYVEPIN